MTYVLLSYKINENILLYGTNPAPRILHKSQISKGDLSNSFTLCIHNHTGTHIDAPKHFIDSGRCISDYSLDELVFKHPTIINCPKKGASLIIPNDLDNASDKFQNADCLLINTGFGRFRNEEKYRTHNPGIAPETILWIRKKFPNIRCIGIDSISISSFQHREIGRQAHKAAFIEDVDLGEPILLIEDMKLDEVSSKKIDKIIVLIWQINDLDSAPCNVLAEVDE